MAKSRVAINAEYWGLRGGCALINALPYPLAMRLARALGWLMVRVFAFKRRRTLERIRSVFPQASDAEAMAIAVRSLQNLLQIGVEMMRSSSLTSKWMDKYIVDGRRNCERLRELVSEGKGVVIMVPHSGNWYMAAWAMAKYGLPLCAIAARQRNPKLNAWMNRQYGDIEVLDRDCRQTLVEIRRRLEQGRAFAILPDLRVRKRDVTVSFLGGEANVSRAGAMYAVKVGSPILVAHLRREKGKHAFKILSVLRPDPVATDRHAEAERLTREAMRLIETEIRRYPGDWYWYNKRWILEPPEN